MSIDIVKFEFRGSPLRAVRWKSRWWWPARETGRVLEVSDDGKRFGRNVVDHPQAEEGKHYRMVRGLELLELQVLFDGAKNTPSNFRGGTRRELLMLTEEGIYLAMMAARGRFADEFRFWLADVVLPTLRRRGTHSVANDNAGRMDEIEATIDSLAVAQSTLQQQLAGVENRLLVDVVGPDRAETDILFPIRMFAKRKYAIDRGRSYLGWCAWAHRKLRGFLRFPAPRAHAWERLPSHRLPLLEAILTELRDEVEREARHKGVANDVAEEKPRIKRAVKAK